MAVTAGYKTSIKVSATTDSGYAALGRCTNVSLGFTRADLDTTMFETSSGGARQRIAGIKDAPVKLDCDYEVADAGQTIIIARWADGASCWVQIKWDDSAGHNVECKVIGMPITSTPSGKVTVSYDLQATGAVDASMH